MPAGEAQQQTSWNGTSEDVVLKRLELFKQMHSDGLLSTEVYHELQVELGKSVIPPADTKGRGSAPYDRARMRTGSSSRTWKSGWGILGAFGVQCQLPCRFHTALCVSVRVRAQEREFVWMCRASSLR